MAKKKVEAAAAPTKPAPRGALISSRQRKKISRIAMWLLPVLAAFLVAYIFGSEEAPISTADTNQGAVAQEGEEEQSNEPPPVDIWAKPSECTAWAGDGQCTANVEFMLKQCAWSCHKLTLAQKRYDKRCPRPENYTAALPPGQLMATFERVMSDFPHLKPERISVDPPVVLFHSFLSEAEVDSFVSHGKGRYEKSLGVGMMEDGTMGDVQTEIRTSSHGWCKHSECLSDPNVQAVVARVSNITLTPATNAEFAQLVYYHACVDPTDKKCAFYKEHNDYIEGDQQKLQGVRIYTLFAYLNDVPSGGGTRFTKLPNGPVLFQPQKGKAILWPSVLENDPHNKDSRTDHEALPVTAGEKFGANFWIHQHDFKTSYKMGCTAS